jgi:hypothetical protein
MQCFLLTICFAKYLSLNYVVYGGGLGRGLAPTRGSIMLTYDHRPLATWNAHAF